MNVAYHSSTSRPGAQASPPDAGSNRHAKAYPMNNEVRVAVYRAIRRSPGVHVAHVAEEVGVSRSTVRYHTRVLERERLVFGALIRGRRRYYPTGSADLELSAALADEATAGIVDVLARLGPSTVTEVAAALERSPSTISYHLSRLTAVGVVERTREGSSVSCRLTVPATTDRGTNSGRGR